MWYKKVEHSVGVSNEELTKKIEDVRMKSR